MTFSMFKAQDIALINDALDMAIASNKRAQNSSKNPKLTPVYNQIQKDYEELKGKLATVTADQLNKALSAPNK